MAFELLVIDRGHFRDDTAMVLGNSWRLLAGGALFSSVAFGCAAEQVDDLPRDSDEGAAPSASGAAQSGGGGAGGAEPTSAGSPSSGAPSAAGKGGATSSTAGSPSVAGTGAGGSTAGSGGSGPIKPVNTSLPFSEDFEDGEANGFIPWNEDMMTGAWGVVADGAGKVYQPAAAVAELEFAVGGSTTWTDVVFTARVRLNDAESGAHIVLRFKPKTYLVVEMAEGKYKLRGRADGSTTDLIAPSPKPVITAGTWYKVGVTAKGSMVSLTLDDMPIGSPASAAAAISSGGIALGVAEGSVSYDDVSVISAP